MGVAFLSAMRSKDPRTQVGACIVNKDKRIVGVGYNGFPMGCDDDALPWARTSEAGDPMEVKYSYICHAVCISTHGPIILPCSIFSLCLYCTPLMTTITTDYCFNVKEMNAILNKNAADVVGCTMYVALFPCNECAKLIIQSGIKRVMFLSDKYHGEPSMRASRRMLDMAGVEYTQYIPTVKSIEVKFFDTDTETDKMLYNVQSTDNDSSS